MLVAMQNILAAGATADANRRALQQVPQAAARMPWLWMVLGVLLLCAGGAAAVLWIARRYARRQARWEEFQRLCGRAALTDAERKLLARATRLAALDAAPERVFTDAAAFNKGAALLTQRDHATASDSCDGICAGCGFLLSLREKLGFDAELGDRSDGEVRLGAIEPGTALAAYRQVVPENLEVYVTDTRRDGRELVVLPEIPLEASVGERWMIRQPHHGMLWEFTAWVVGNMAGEVVLRPSGRARWINRRRFARVAVRRPGRIAPFPLHRAEWDRETPQFVRAVVTDLGGPGMRLEAPLRVEPGDRVLVTTRLPDRLIEAIGVVRHTRPTDGGLHEIALELIGLDTAEIAELARLANGMTPRPREDEPEAAPREPAGAGEREVSHV